MYDFNEDEAERERELRREREIDQIFNDVMLASVIAIGLTLIVIFAGLIWWAWT